MNYQFNGYTFSHNPTQADKDITYIGDNVKTLSGRMIIQPTYFKNSTSIVSTFWQARDLSLLPIPINDNVICFNKSTNNFYTYNLSGEVINIYNSNLLYINSIDLSLLTLTSVDDITSFGSNVYLSASNLSGRQIYTIPIQPTQPTYNLASIVNTASQLNNAELFVASVEAGSLLFEYILGIPNIENVPTGVPIAATVMGMANDGTNIWILDSNHNISSFQGGVLYPEMSLNTQTTGLEFSNGLFLTIYNNGANTLMLSVGTTPQGIAEIVDGTYVPETATIESICLKNTNTLYYIDANHNQVYNMSINTVLQDIYHLEYMCEMGGVLPLTDQYGRTEYVTVLEIDKKRLDKLPKAYQVTIKTEGVW
jgi:hypothetical protein